MAIKPKLGDLSEEEKKRLYNPINPCILANAIQDDYKYDPNLEVRLVPSHRIKRVSQFEISFCEQCQVWQARCPECEMGGCSGGHKQGCRSVETELKVHDSLEFLMGSTNLEELLNRGISVDYDSDKKL